TSRDLFDFLDTDHRSERCRADVFHDSALAFPVFHSETAGKRQYAKNLSECDLYVFHLWVFFCGRICSEFISASLLTHHSNEEKIRCISYRDAEIFSNFDVWNTVHSGEKNRKGKSGFEFAQNHYCQSYFATRYSNDGNAPQTIDFYGQQPYFAIEIFRKSHSN